MDWKKEIKLSDLVGRKSAPKAPAAKGPPAEKSVPFWKKEISLGRKPKTEAEPAAEPPVLEPVADEDWVREQLAAATAAAAATEVPPPAPGIHPPVPASELPKPPKEKKSLLKRELSFRRKPKPKAPKQPEGEQQPKEPKQPRAK